MLKRIPWQSPVVKTLRFHCRGIPSLVGELISQMLHNVAKKKKKLLKTPPWTCTRLVCNILTWPVLSVQTSVPHPLLPAVLLPIDLLRALTPISIHLCDYALWVVCQPEPGILGCEVKWALGSTAVNKASRCNGIPRELFRTRKDDAVKVLHTLMSANLEDPAVATGILVRSCLTSCMLGFSIMWTKNFQMSKRPSWV